MDLAGSSETGASDVSTNMAEAPEKPVPSGVEGTVSSKAKGADPAPAAAENSRSVKPLIYPVEVDHSRDSLLTDFGKDTLTDRYLLPGESYQDLFVRVASAYADDAEHAQRLYD